MDLKRLKAERIANGLTQDDMAEAMGWKSRTPYAKRENGLIGIGADELVKMANILGYNENQLGIFLRESFPKKNNQFRKENLNERCIKNTLPTFYGSSGRKRKL